MINSFLEISFWSLLPISELRGGIPLAIYKGISIYSALIICVLSNCLVIPLVFFFLDNLHENFMVNNFYSKLFNKYIDKKRLSLEKYIGEPYKKLTYKIAGTSLGKKFAKFFKRFWSCPRD